MLQGKVNHVDANGAERGPAEDEAEAAWRGSWELQHPLLSLIRGTDAERQTSIATLRAGRPFPNLSGFREKLGIWILCLNEKNNLNVGIK